MEKTGPEQPQSLRVAALALLLLAFSLGLIIGYAQKAPTPERVPDRAAHSPIPASEPVVATVKTAGQAPTVVNPGESGVVRVPAGQPVKITGVPHQVKVLVDDTAVLWTRTGKGNIIIDQLLPRQSVSFTMRTPRPFTVDVKARDADRANIFVSPDETQAEFGVGIPVQVAFSHPVAGDARESVVAALEVQTSEGDISGVSGVAYWPTDQLLLWRPASFWPGESTITYTLALGSVQLSPGVWGQDVSGQFRTGVAQTITVNLDTHALQFWRNGTPAGPPLATSGGMPGWETADGWKIVYEKYETKRLYNPDPVEGWDVTVPWAMRLTAGGEFIHTAGWNTQLGEANTSHGCTNLSEYDAAWLFQRVNIGDPVFTAGGGGPVPVWDGLGGLWNLAPTPDFP